MRREAGFLDRGDLGFEDPPALRVFVAQIDVGFLGLDRPGGDQHPLDKAMRVGFEEIAVLEGAGLALIGIDREEARLWLLAHKAPFAPGRKPGAAEAAQPGGFERGDHLVDRPRAGNTGLQQPIAAAGAVGGKVRIGRDRRMGIARRDRGGDAVARGVLMQRVADRHHRRLVAAAHAGRPHHAHAVAEADAQLIEQPLGAGERAAQAVAHAHGQRRRRCLVVHDDVEMRVERGDLVDLGQREAHRLGERDQMACMEAAEMVLQQMQVLDQEVAAALALAEQRLDLGERRGIDLAALRVIRSAPPPRARVDAAVVMG